MTSDDNREAREAREWLKYLQTPGATSAAWADNAATILRLLDQPVLPRGADVPDDVVEEMWKAYAKAILRVDGIRAALDVLREHLTAPPPVKPKKVDRWCIVSSSGEIVSGYATKEEALSRDRGPRTRIVHLMEAADDDQ